MVCVAHGDEVHLANDGKSVVFGGVEIVSHPFLAFVAAGAGPVGLDFADCIHLVPVFAHVCGNLCFRFVERGSVIAVQHAVGLAVDGFGAVKTQIDVSGVGSSLSDVLGCIMPFHALAHHRHICPVGSCRCYCCHCHQN